MTRSAEPAHKSYDLFAAVGKASLYQETEAREHHGAALPAWSVRSSHAGNARPERKMAACAASSKGRERKYSATRRTFSVFLVVAATASQVVAKASMEGVSR